MLYWTRFHIVIDALDIGKTNPVWEYITQKLTRIYNVFEMR
jgi:hypothetical protein